MEIQRRVKGSTEETGAISERLEKESGKKWDVNQGPVLWVCCRHEERTVETSGDRSVTMTARSVKHAQETMSLGEGWAWIYSAVGQEVKQQTDTKAGVGPIRGNELLPSGNALGFYVALHLHHPCSWLIPSVSPTQSHLKLSMPRGRWTHFQPCALRVASTSRESQIP